MEPIVASSGALDAALQYGSFLIGTVEGHAGFFLTLLGISVIMGLLVRKMG